MFSRTPILRLFLIVNLLLVVALLGSNFIPLPKSSENALATSGDDDIENLLAERKGDVDEAKARPLFHESRRPPTTRVASKPAAPVKKKAEFAYRLVGIVGSAKSSRSAYLQDSRTQETVVVKAGHVLGDWKIERVDANLILVFGPDGEKTLELASGGR